jgi:hypothetical protein
VVVGAFAGFADEEKRRVPIYLSKGDLLAGYRVV